MPNPQLTAEQRERLFKPLMALVKAELERLAAGDPQVLWALRRKLAKELGYLERGVPNERRALKARKMKEQSGICPICHQRLPDSGAELDRREAVLGYTDANTRLVHHECHVADQRAKKFK